MNEFDWAAIETANASRARLAAAPARSARVANGSHEDCDHAFDFCALTADNRFAAVSA
jgi:hypothetical protein